MGWWTEAKYLFRKLNRRRAEQETEEEIHAHLEMETREHIEAGLSPEAAGDAARRAFGGVLLARERSRAMWGFGNVESFWQDLRYGGRMLLKNPGFTLVAMITLSMGIGANTAIFSVVNGVLLRPLPFNEPERILSLWATDAKRGQNRRVVSYPNFDDWRTQGSVFEKIAAYEETTATLTGSGAPEQLHGLNASADLFPLLGVQPLLGRWFSEQEARASDAATVIISEDLWRRRFSADGKMVGRAIIFNGQSCIVVGVMPASFNFPLDENSPTEFWRVLKSDQERGSNHLTVIARLKPAITMSQAQVEMDTVAARLTAQYPGFNTGRGVRLTGLQEDLTRNVQKALLVLLASVGGVLLIACANVANLLLARVTGRQKEIAVRVALGATRGRVIRQLLVESALLAGMGGAVGAFIATWGIAGLRPLLPIEKPLAQGVALDWRVLAASLTLSLLTGLLFGLAPALQAVKSNLADALKEEGHSLTGGSHRNRVRATLVVLEVALSLSLLIGAGLLMRSFLQLLDVNPGFNPERVIAFDFSLPGARYVKQDQQTGFYHQLTERIASLPGVEVASVGDPLPLSNSTSSASVIIEGQPPLTPAERPKTLLHFIDRNYLRALSMPLLQGRALSDNDHKDAPKVMLVSESFARRFFPKQNPLGKSVDIGIDSDSNYQIVGVVGDVKTRSLDAVVEPECYLSYLQNPISEMSLIVRVSGADPAGISPSVQKVIEQMDNELAISDIRTMQQLVTATLAPQRFNLLMLGLFAGLALSLAVVGVYSVMAYFVSQRTHEIGVRLALGAQSRDVLRLVVGQGMALTLAGVGIGLLASAGLTQLIKTMLFGVSPTDPLTFAVITGLLILAALLACWIPARRATRVDPLVAMRSE